ncbi:hypothetical protein MAFF241648_21380 [Ralstonia solanacearum]|nr:hypothetical protein MAFF241648_21380 [Ralstonia solanacearum]
MQTSYIFAHERAQNIQVLNGVIDYEPFDIDSMGDLSIARVLAARMKNLSRDTQFIIIYTDDAPGLAHMRSELF